GALDVGARGLEQRAEWDTGRTRGFARAAAEAEIEVARVRVRDVQAALGHRAHQIDAAAGRVHLLAERAIRRTDGAADPAVHPRSNRGDCSGVREAGFSRGWPVRDGSWFHHARSTVS